MFIHYQHIFDSRKQNIFKDFTYVFGVHFANRIVYIKYTFWTYYLLLEAGFQLCV